MENWRIFIRESLPGFTYSDVSPWSLQSIKNEYIEEIIGSYKFNIVSERWPNIKNFNNYPFLNEDSEQEFIDAITSAKIQKLSLSEMKEVHNHNQVRDIITMMENGQSIEEIHDIIANHFAEKGDLIKNKKYKKIESYSRWVEAFKSDSSINGTPWPVEPPILVRQEDGSLAHIAGQTRQTGALINRKIIPYVILEAKKDNV